MDEKVGILDMIMLSFAMFLFYLFLNLCILEDEIGAKCLWFVTDVVIL